MRPRLRFSNEEERNVFRLARAFLKDRLEEAPTLNWALKINQDEHSKRWAILDLVNAQYKELKEPWRTAWKLMEEFWENPPVDTHHIDIHDIAQSIKAGDRSGALVAQIVKSVAPRLSIEEFSPYHLRYTHPPANPKHVRDLFTTDITSGEVVDPASLNISLVDEPAFLNSIACNLEACISQGLDIGRRLGWDIERIYYFGGLNRVYFVPPSQRLNSNKHEPDEFHRGIAPSVKLLHGVIAQLFEVAPQEAIRYLKRWLVTPTFIHTRLWAAFATDSHLISPEQVGTFLLNLSDAYFWDINKYPEISELRAQRYKDLTASDKLLISRRIKGLPPGKIWWPKMDRVERNDARIYWAVREFKRIELENGALHVKDRDWVERYIHKYPDLMAMSRKDEGFPESVEARWIEPKPAEKYSSLHGELRLVEIENALIAPRTWEDDPGHNARDWVRSENHVKLLIHDLSTIKDGGNSFPHVWEVVGWTHTPTSEDLNRVDCDEVRTMIRLMLRLDSEAINIAIEGLTFWLDNWRKFVVTDRRFGRVWRKFWPIAVEATNRMQADEDLIDLNTVAKTQSEPKDLDTLNTPAGRMVGLFLSCCPNLNEEDHPFAKGKIEYLIRSQIISAPGRSGLIAKHRMLEQMPYFLNADPKWTSTYLAKELHSQSIEVLPLWRAISRRTHFQNVLKVIGTEMARRVRDTRLGRESRRSLLFSLVVECMHAFMEERNPVVDSSLITQTIRSVEVEDEIRTGAIRAVHDFLRDMSSPDSPNRSTPEVVFEKAIKPFLQTIWPQERSLVTPGISKSLADVPIISNAAFADAVDTISPYLMPFDCWTLYDYGIRVREGNDNLHEIDDTTKAHALLTLFNLTIGENIIPHDLGDALQRIEELAPKLSDSPEFKRLVTATRRI